MKNNSMNIPKYILFTLLGGLIGSIVTFLLIDNIGINTKCNVTSINDSKFEPVMEAYNTIKNEYYKDIDDSVLIDGMINGLMSATEDPHTTYYNESETSNFEAELSGKYYGIGAQIYQNDDNNVSVNLIFDNSPAEKAGLKVGDTFISVDEESVLGKTPTEVSSLLRSADNPKAKVVVKRGEEEVNIEIEKSMVEISSVSSEMLDNNIGYISLSTFNSLTDDQFSDALTKLDKEGAKSLIIDLRGNGGGYLSTVTNIISKFVNKKTVIYQIKDKKSTEKYYSLNDSTLNYKVVILINEESASASEIMCSALQEQYGAILVGKTTFGKGTVQEVRELPNKTVFKFTMQEWLTSKGKSINGVGVKPDYDIDLPEDYYSNPTLENDTQLQKAIELLK